MSFRIATIAVPQAGRQAARPASAHGFEECIYVLPGQGVMRGERRIPVGPGDIVLVPPARST